VPTSAQVPSTTSTQPSTLSDENHSTIGTDACTETVVPRTSSARPLTIAVRVPSTSWSAAADTETAGGSRTRTTAVCEPAAVRRRAPAEACHGSVRCTTCSPSVALTVTSRRQAVEDHSLVNLTARIRVLLI